MYPAHRILSRAVENFPDRIAFVDGDSRLTYRELGRRVNQLANGLRGLGLNKVTGWLSLIGIRIIMPRLTMLVR